MLSESNILDEPHAQVVANKDKQIELLSNMLEQKGTQLRKQKEDFEDGLKQIKDKDTQVEKVTIENQELKVKVGKLQTLINNDSNAKAVYNAELLMEQSKNMKNRIEQMHKQSQLKDQEISNLHSRQAEYEKRFVLL